MGTRSSVKRTMNPAAADEWLQMHGNNYEWRWMSVENPPDNSDISNVDSIPIRGPVGNGQRDFMDNLSSTDDLFYYQSTNQSAMFGSLVLHAVIIVLALLSFTSTTFYGAAKEEVRSGGIVLVEQIGDNPEYFQEKTTFLVIQLKVFSHL